MTAGYTVPMRLPDLARAAFGGLWRQKARTLLTLTGVVVGTCSFAFSLSLGVGLRAMIDREFRKRDEFWWGPRPFAAARHGRGGRRGHPPGRTRRRGRAVAGRGRTDPGPEAAGVPPADAAEANQAPHAGTDRADAALPDVEEVRVFRNGYAIGTVAGRNADAFVAATRLDIYDPPYDNRLLAGRMPADPAAECLISEYFAYKLGARYPAAVAGLVGQSLSLTLGEPDNQKAFSLAACSRRTRPR